MFAVRFLDGQGEGGLVQVLAVLFLRGVRVLGVCMRPRACWTRGASDLFFTEFGFGRETGALRYNLRWPYGVQGVPGG